MSISHYPPNNLFNTLTLVGTLSGQVSIGVPATVASYNLTLPPSQGGAGEVLVNDGSGNLSWSVGSGADSFYIMQTPLGTAPTATSATDILTWTNNDGLIDITGNAGTDTIDLSLDLASFPDASGSTRGFLTAADWTTFNNKQAALSFPITIAQGGTNSASALNNNRIMQSSGGAIVEAAAITAARALISDANGIPTQSSVTSTELGYVSGVTSAIQTQLNGKQASLTLPLSASQGGTGVANNAASTVTISGSFGLTLTLSYTTSVTLPLSGTLATLAGSETLTNKTLTSPIISTISNTGTLTLPTSTDTLVGRATTDTLTNKTLTSPVLNSATVGTQMTFGNYHMEPSETDDGNSGTSDTIDWSQGSAHKSTLTGNVTYTFSNPVTGGSYVLRVLTGSGGFTVTWPATVKWQGATTPTITSTASRMDLFNFYYDGTNYYGSYIQNYTP